MHLNWVYIFSYLLIEGLIDDMIACVARKSRPHYFVPEVNLFEGVPDDFLQTCGQKLIELRKTFPDRHLLQNARSDRWVQQQARRLRFDALRDFGAQ